MVVKPSQVVRWFCEIVGYPDGAGGFLTTGGSLANFSAVVTARQRHLGEEPSRGVAYVSDQGHHSLEKAASLAGIPSSRVRVLPVDERFRLRPEALAEAVARDRAAGLDPFLLCGSAGAPNRDAGAPNARSARRSAAFVALGLLVLCVGAELTVRGAVGVARSLGISEVVIGLTVIAVGTSLPELVASLIATVRGEVDLAIGNVIGSNIFNLLLVAGLTATVRPIAVPDGGHADLGAMAVLSVLLVLVSMSHSRRIIRLEAGGLFLVYAVYLVARSAGG